MDDPGGSTYPSSASSERHQEEHHQHGHNKAAQSSAVSVYLADVAGATRKVTVSWSKTLINHSLSISIEQLPGGAPLACKVDLKPWPFWSKKGFKSLELDRQRVDVFWDFRSAKFSSRPEPSGGYYVALVCEGEVALLLGDCKKEAYKRAKSRPSLVDASLVSRRECVFGKRTFSARGVRFGDGCRKEHEVVVESSVAGGAAGSTARGAPPTELWISIDGEVLIHVDNLQWKFRGNETVVVERVPLQVFWDVHGWLFGNSGDAAAAVAVGQAVFMFKPGAPLEQAATDAGVGHGGTGGESNEAKTAAWTARESDCRVVPEFCFFLYAWKME